MHVQEATRGSGRAAAAAHNCSSELKGGNRRLEAEVVRRPAAG